MNGINYDADARGRLAPRGPGGERRRGAGCGTAAGHRPARTMRPDVSGSTWRGSGPGTCSRARALATIQRKNND